MEELLRREGYNVTRYQADTVTFNAQTRTLSLDGRASRVAAVQRDSQLVVADTGIIYSERTGEAVARGNLVFRDPNRSAADVIARGPATYNLREGSARVYGGRTSVESGETWFVSADIFAFLQARDSANGDAATFYGLRGRLTSCSDTLHNVRFRDGTPVPHYHFHFREIKKRGSFMVARPGILYIADVPVFWLPFIFQDMRSGRRSGVLTPRFGVSDIVRNSPSYRRNIENVGYYWAISDYMDAELSFDWRSGTGGRADDIDPGWMRFNGQWQYNWLARFLRGSIASSYTTQNDGNKNLAVTWGHQQSFTRDRNINANLNYVSSTRLQRQNTFNPYTALATIRSQLNFADKIGPASIQLGGTRTQYPGREQVDQTLPTLSITTGAINLAPWLVWTPGLQFNEQRSLHIDQPGIFATRFQVNEQGDTLSRDSVRKDTRATSLTFDTPLQIFGFDLRNSFRYSDDLQDFPDIVRLVQVDSPYTVTERIFARRFTTSLDWTPSFSLPGVSRGRWNINPNVSLQNVSASDPFMVRTFRSNGRWVRQTKRPTFGLGVSPTFFGLIPGFFGYSRFRHAIQPTISYTFAPKADVNDEFLAAVGISRQGYLGALAQNSVSLGLTQNIEGKRRSPRDTNPEAAQKIKLLTLNFSSLNYDFERARKTGDPMRGLTTTTFNYSARSDLLPNVDVSADYSLFEGNPESDTARFSPYRTRISANFSINRRSNPFAILTRIFGRAVPANTIPAAEMADPDTTRHDETRRLAVQPVAGARARAAQFVVPAREGWEASFSFSSTRDRPPRGNFRVVDYDPEIRCAPFLNVDPFAFDECVRIQRSNPSIDAPFTPSRGGTTYRSPPVTSLNADINFHLTPKWAAAWQTSYDFVAGDFASHVVSLQRDLHDWRAVFAFTQSTNGNFAFNFFIALKAQPDLKFDYNRATYR